MRFYVTLFLFLLSTCTIIAQQGLTELLQLAETNYPLLKSKALEVQAAQKNIEVSNGSRIPSLDAMYQMNYATHNNISGMFYPQLLLPISGPPSPSNDMGAVFGSGASLLLNWQPLTFGQQQSQVDYAKAGLQYVNADAANEIFKHKVSVVNAYLDLLTAAEFIKLYEENVRRTEETLGLIKTLVLTGLKPGVDSALLKAEASKARVDLLNARKFKDQSIIILSQLLATDSIPALSDTSYFTKLPVTNVANDTVKNPLLSLYSSTIDLSNARKKMIAKTMMPTLGVWGSAYARGSGVSHTGTVKAIDGLGFQRYNYGLGFQLSVPILQFARLKPQLQQQDFIIKSNEEKLNDISLQLQKQTELAETTMNNSLAVAKETPLYYESAAFSYKALLSRYESGLANFADLVQSQYALIKAATDNKAAYMNVWKALLFKAAVAGDLNLFLNQLK